MNKNLLNFLLTLILVGVTAFVLPWWSVMLCAFITTMCIPLKKAAVFFVPFLAVFLFWFSYMFFLSSSNDYILAKKIAVLLPLGGNAFLLILVSSIIGSIAAGIAAVFGKQTVLLFKQ
ncbi:hypothetical protein [Winogradskyella sp. A3E31]|uniref:hypothetical protein n=1 Tax=Winogradskyella sp. A3E31 TaxID=3349637 RepID=UPI00398A5564